MNFGETITSLLGPFLIGVLVSTGIGLIIGLEREFDKQHLENSHSGIRTFPITAVTAFMIASLSDIYSIWIVLISIPAIVIFLVASYVLKVRNDQRGITTEMSLFATFILGILVAEDLITEALASAVVIMTLLALKPKLRALLRQITQEEIYAFVKFSILSMLILPFLPDEGYGPEELLNPREIGWVVILVSMINFIGYFMVKFIGPKKGVFMMGIMGGLISSTGLTWAFSSRSSENKDLSKEYAAGIILASGIMFPRLFLIALVFNQKLVSTLWLPFLIMSLCCLIPAWLMIRKSDPQKAKGEINLGNPLNILNAMVFALIFVAIMFATYYGKEWLGEGGLFATAIISGLADTDAITISMAKFGHESVTQLMVTAVIVAATISNMVVKGGITLVRGSAEAGKTVGKVFAGAAGAGILYILAILLFFS